MNANRYNTAGWLAVIIVPLYFIGAMIIAAQHVVAAVKGGSDSIPLGPGDIVFGVLDLLGAYLYWIFLRLLHERYNFHGADIYIRIEIAIGLLTSLVLMPLLFILRPDGSTVAPFCVPVLLLIGFLDIQIARKILAAKCDFDSMIPTYATVLMFNGCCVVSIIFSFMSFLFLEPIALVILGMVFLREKEQVEFV